MEQICFAKDKRGNCTALNICDCRGCRFYKTRDQIKRDTEAVNARLSSLPVEDQQTIADAYTQGKMVWQK